MVKLYQKAEPLFTYTECVTNLDYQIKMIIFVSILTTFEASFVFSGSWGSRKIGLSL